MKSTRKTVVAAVLSAVAVLAACCMGACANQTPDAPPKDPKIEASQALSKAFQANMYADNVTVTTTDTRTNKFGYYVPKVRKLRVDGNEGKAYLDDSGNPEFPEEQYAVAKKDGDSVSVKTCRHDLNEQVPEYEYSVPPQPNIWNLNNYGEYGTDKYTESQWIGRCILLGGDWIEQCHISASEEGMGFALDNALFNGDFPFEYTESTNTVEFKNVYYVQTYNMDVLGYHPCSVTVKLDSQNRFSKVICNFTDNGVLTSTYEYGNTTIGFPQNVEDMLA